MPLLITTHNEIVTGEARVAAAMEIGMDLIPTILVEQLTPEHVRTYGIADSVTNKS